MYTFSFRVSAKNLDITKFVDYVMFLTLRILWKHFISFLIIHNPSADHNISHHKLSFSTKISPFFLFPFFPWRPKNFPPPKFSYIPWLELANSSHLIFFRFCLCIVSISRHCYKKKTHIAATLANGIDARVCVWAEGDFIADICILYIADIFSFSPFTFGNKFIKTISQ